MRLAAVQAAKRSAESPMPQITIQPLSLELEEGQPGSITVEAKNDEGGYQWYKNEVIINFETSNVLSFDSLTTGDNGIYYCVVKNAAGQPVKSNEVIVSITAKPVSVATQRIGIGDSLEATIGLPDTSNYNAVPFILSNDGLSKQIWREVGNPASFLNIFGYPGQTASWFYNNQKDYVKQFVLPDVPRLIFDIYYGTNDLTEKTASEVFANLKAIHDWVHNEYGDRVKTIAKPCLNRTDTGAPSDFDSKRIELRNLLKANFESNAPFMDGFVDLGLDNMVWPASVSQNPALMAAPDKDGYYGLHYTKLLCSYIAKDSKPVYDSLHWSNNSSVDFDTTGGSGLPAINLSPAQGGSLSPVNLPPPVNGVYYSGTPADTASNFNAYMLMDKKIPAGQDGYVQYEVPYKGLMAMFGLRTNKANTAFAGNYKVNTWSDGGMGVYSFQDDGAGGTIYNQCFQGDIIRYTRKIINGQGIISMYRSCLDKSKFFKIKEFTFKSTADLYIQVSLAENGSIANLQASNNCVDI